MATRGGISITFTIDSDDVREGLRAQRRAIGQDVKRTTGDAARKVTLPVAKQDAPTVIRQTLTARSGTGGAWLTTTARGKRRAIVAVTNWGGTIKTEILPRRRKALKFGGRYAARVTAPRTVKGTRYMENAVKKTLPRYVDQVERDLERIMRSRIIAAGTF